jgi:hypothetical protein
MTKSMLVNQFAGAVLLAVGCSVEVAEPPIAETAQDLTRTQDEFLELAIHDALCHCEALLVDDSMDLIGDTALGPWYTRYINRYGGSGARVACADLETPNPG